MSLPHQVATFLMGFRPVPNSVFVAEHYDANRKEREDVMREALKGYNLVIADQKITNLNLLRKVLQEIGQAEYGIAEITELNENVILELGIMYGLNKPALILAKNTQSSDFVPSNLQGQEQLRYADNEELSRKLRDGMANVSELLRKQPSDADVQWLAGLLEMAAEHFEVLALAMKLEEKHLTARIV